MNFATLGQYQFGEFVFSQSDNLPIVVDSTNTLSYKRVQVGFGQFGNRGYSKPKQYYPRIIDEDKAKIATISIVSASGALVGKIRTDVQKTIVFDLSFTLDEKGCADFSLKLNKLPEFPILPFSIMAIKIGNTSFNWYQGEITYTDDLSLDSTLYEFRGNGLRNYLNGLKSDVDYPTGQDIGEVVKDLVINHIVPYAPIKYNSSKINLVTGVILTNPIELGKSFLNKVLDTLAQLANHNWGVDGEGELYFEPVDKQKIQKTYFIGYDLQKFKPKLNLQEVKNSVLIQRQHGRGSGGVGWAIGGIYNDVSSVKKYGKKELDLQLPGYFEQQEIDIIGDSILEEKSEPKHSAMTDGFIVQGGLDYQRRGLYRFILPLKNYNVIYDDVDDISHWVKGGVGDLNISKDQNLFVHGNGSIKFSFGNSQADYAYITNLIKGNIVRVQCYIRSNRVGSFASIGVGLTNIQENLYKLDFPVKDSFYSLEWNVKSLGLKKIAKFGIQIEENVEPTEIHIDKIVFTIKGHNFYKIALKKSRYKFSPSNQSISSEFGILPPKMENYVSALKTTTQELRFTGEVR